ncbi:MAG: spore coat protein [Clostridiales bacterium]|nr:spore coat protein [Clostridiales bacterium]MCF8021791.1 spore coat protein [Clostridiales bacterium]
MQQKNTIKNPKTPGEPSVKGPQMYDRDRLNDILATEKYLTDGFNVMAREASHRQLYNDAMQILNETHHCTRDIFNLMFQKGWYKLEGEDSQKLQQLQQQFQNYTSQFPYGQPHFQ